MITQGSNVTITHQIVVDGQVAFEANDVVLVKSISPNPQRPDYKYVVFSTKVNQSFQLSDADVREMVFAPPVFPSGTVPLNVPTPVMPVYNQQSGMSQGTKVGIVSVLAVLIAVGVLVGWFYYAGSKAKGSVNISMGQIVHSTSTDDSGRTLWACQVTVTNKGSKTIDSVESCFSASSSAGDTGELASIQTLDPTAMDLRGQLLPGAFMTGWVAFAIPNAESGGTLKFTDSASGSTKEWTLYKP